jgi:hypothetical protein
MKRRHATGRDVDASEHANQNTVDTQPRYTTVNWHTVCSCVYQRPQKADDYTAGGPLSMQEKNPNLGDEQKKQGEYGETGKQGGQGQGDIGKKGGDFGGGQPGQGGQGGQGQQKPRQGETGEVGR